MIVGARDARELRKTIKTAITFTIFNISLSNFRYIIDVYNIVVSNEHESTRMHVNLAALIG